MASQISFPPRTKADRLRNFLGCGLLIFLIITIPICLILGWLGGVPDNIMRWVKSFEFPAIEARYKPIADELAAATSDVLIDQSRSIGNFTLMTSDVYTGEVGGNFSKIFATNRPIDTVLDDYARLFLARSDWNIDNEYISDWNVYKELTLATNSSHTAKILITEAPKNQYPEARAKYRNVYEIDLYYGDPILVEG